MRKKHLPKAVFEVGAVAVARIHLATGKPLEEVARSIWSEYEILCEDPFAVRDLALAASQILAWMREKELPALQHLLRHLQYFCHAFGDDGRERKRSLLSGLWFKRDDYDPKRVDAFFRKAQVYCASAQAGLVPLAPDNYH